MDKSKDKRIILENLEVLKCDKEVICMAENNSQLLNNVYREISEKMGMDAAMQIYQMFKGQQISFPARFFSPVKVQEMIVKEYDGKNIRTLAIKYNYSEKTIRRIIHNSVKTKII